MNKVAIVGMDGVFPHCKDIHEFEEKIFNNQSNETTYSHFFLDALTILSRDLGFK